MFEKMIKAQITKARIVAMNKIQADEAGLGALVTTVDYAKWNEVTSNDKNAVASEYRRLFPFSEGEDRDMYDGKNIRVDADRIITLPSGKEMPVLLWAVNRARTIKDI